MGFSVGVESLVRVGVGNGGCLTMEVGWEGYKIAMVVGIP